MSAQLIVLPVREHHDATELRRHLGALLMERICPRALQVVETLAEPVLGQPGAGFVACVPFYAVLYRFSG